MAGPLIVLASGSPRRKALLEQIGLDFCVLSPDASELKGGLPPGPLTMHNARLKAIAAANMVKEPSIVVAADTVVAVGGEILGKPADGAVAKDMLKKLSGKRHEVTTGVCVLRTGGRESGAGVKEPEITLFYETTGVTIRPLSGGEIDAYVASGEPADKAGAYAVQGLGSVVVTRIEGDYYTVMGLPVARLCEELKAFGVETLK
jgi:septum formation protein